MSGVKFVTKKFILFSVSLQETPRSTKNIIILRKFQDDCI